MQPLVCARAPLVSFRLDPSNERFLGVLVQMAAHFEHALGNVRVWMVFGVSDACLRGFDDALLRAVRAEWLRWRERALPVHLCS
jgi:hypothetical protein